MITNPFVLIVGPTASGKSALGLQLAEHFQGAVLNCDSLQIYKRLDIGTAKPDAEERARVPHLLFDFLAPGEVLTAGDFRKLALEELAQHLPHRPVFGVGGSGFYIQALEKGMFDVKKPSSEIDAQVREDLKSKGLPALYRELEACDPEYADHLSPNDSYRIVRALVVFRETGRKVSDLKKEFARRDFPYPLLKLGLLPSREELLPRIQSRTRKMIKDGLIEEVEALRGEGFSGWPALQSVGYKECQMFLNGEIDRARLEQLISEKTVQLAKKQRTWFKRDTEIQVLDFEHPFPEAVSAVSAFLDRLRVNA